MALLPGQTTLLDVIEAVCSEADLPTPSTTTFITKDEMIGWVQRAHAELYGLLVTKFDGRYFDTGEHTFTTDGTSEGYTLPDGSGTAPAFFKLLGVEMLNGSSWLAIDPFEFRERNRCVNPAECSSRLGFRYRLRGPKLYLSPLPDSGVQIRVLYVPRLTPVSADADVIDGVNGWEDVIIASCCAKAMRKQQLDDTPFLRQRSALLQRIDAEAANRDAGAPRRVADVDGSAPWLSDGCCATMRW